MGEQYVYKIDLKNNQSAYSQCLDNIESIEQNRYKGEIKAISLNYLKVIDEKIFADIDNFLLKKRKEIYDSNIYYITVYNVTNANIINLQYLFLMLDKLKKLVEEQRLLIYFVPPEDKNKSKIINKFYYRISAYLSLLFIQDVKIRRILLASKIVIINKNKDEDDKEKKQNICTKTLIETIDPRGSFPLIKLNEEYYNALFRSISLRMGKKGLYINGEDKFTTHFLSIANKFLKRKIEKQLEFEKNSVNKNDIYFFINFEIESVLNSNIGNINLMVFTIFIIIFEYEKDKDISLQIKSYFMKASILSNGIQEIIKNIIDHTSIKIGYLALRKSFKISNQNYHLKENLFKSVLEIYISDLNYDDTIIEHFFYLNKENCNKANLDLDKIRLSDFYKDSNKYVCKKEWENFKRQNSNKITGLQCMVNYLNSLNAILEIKSDKNYMIEYEKNSYGINYYTKDDFFLKDQFFIPGTQYKITIPFFLNEKYDKDTLKKTVNQLKSYTKLIENNESYAKFIEYKNTELKFRKIEIDKKNKTPQEIKSEIKKTYFIDLYNKVYIGKKSYWIDYKKIVAKHIKNIDIICEIFCDLYIKLANNAKSNNPISITIINCDEKFIKEFYKNLKKSLENLILQDLKTSKMQLSLYAKDISKIFIGRNMFEINNSLLNYDMSNCYINVNDKEDAADYFYTRELSNNLIELFPNDVFNFGNKCSIFQNYLDIISEEDLKKEKMAGYKKTNTHVKLSHKIHVNDFYEISILIQKPKIARKIAFMILKDLKRKINLLKDKVYFYGYEAHSRVIINSMIEILNYYKMNHKNSSNKKPEMIIYQKGINMHNNAYLYYNDISILDKNKKLENNSNVVMIVPISATLSTFNEMKELLENYCENKKIKIAANYTAFWLMDEHNKFDYWESYENGIIKSNFVKPDVQYFIKKNIDWLDSLTCEFCYPTNIVDEMPLIETDITSTIPFQQINITSTMHEMDIVNEKRIQYLYNCVNYGHISRNKNHYQYYIDTVRYFNNCKEEIKEWLVSLKDCEQKNDYQDSFLDLNIIVAPNQPTNVEFCQYVNDYYFNGMANVIFIDPNKQFRSNLIAEYTDVIELIKMVRLNLGRVKFYFVDDTIITGDTYLKLNSLMHSITTESYKKGSIVFDKIFVLVDRLSSSSKKNFVANPNENFYCFVHVNISSIRNNGNSCVICNMKKEASRMYLNSSTKFMSEYWQKKMILYKDISFNSRYLKKDDSILLKGFTRLVCSHILSNKVDKSQDEKEILEMIKNVFMPFFNDDSEERDKMNSDLPLTEYFNFCDKSKCSKLYIVKNMLKVLCRPFFSYSESMKKAVFNLYLNLAQKMLNGIHKQTPKECTYENINQLCDCIIKMIPIEEKIDFLFFYVLEGLKDMHSNFLLRKEAIKKINEYLYFHLMSLEQEDQKLQRDFQKYYKILSHFIYELIYSCDDESKCLRLEILLRTYEEPIKDWDISNIKDNRDIKQFFEFSAYLDDSKDRIKQLQIREFKIFWDTLFIENSKILDEAVKTKADQIFSFNLNLSKESIPYKYRNIFTYFALDGMEYKEINSLLLSLTDLFGVLKNGGNNIHVDRYDKLVNSIYNLIKNDVALLSENVGNNMDDVFVIADRINIKEKSRSRVMKVLSNNSTKDFLEEYSYYINEDKKFVVIQLNNNYSYLNKETTIKGIKWKKGFQKIAPVLIYIEYKANPLSIIRMILLFRHYIIKWIEDDFNNNVMSNLEKYKRDYEFSMQEKMIDHSQKGEIYEMMNTFHNNYEIDMTKDENYIQFFQFYINVRIARFYRMMMREFSNIAEKNKQLTYLISDEDNYIRLLTLNELTFDYLEHFNNFFIIKWGSNEELPNFKSLRLKCKDIRCIKKRNRSLPVYYCAEFITYLIIDILLSAMKHYKGEYTNKSIREICTNMYHNNEKVDIKFSLESYNQKVDALVIQNKIKETNLTEDEMKNLNRELSSSYDELNYNLGMSTSVLKWYIANMKKDGAYVPKLEIIKKENDYIFQTKLPIVEKGQHKNR